MQPTNSILLAVLLRALLIGAMPAPLPSRVDDNATLEHRDVYYSSAPFSSNLLNVPHTNLLASKAPLTKTAFVTVTATAAVTRTQTAAYAPPKVSQGSLSILTHAPTIIQSTVTATTSVTRTLQPTRAPPHVIPGFSRASSSTPPPPPSPTTTKAPPPPSTTIPLPQILATQVPRPHTSKSSSKPSPTTTYPTNGLYPLPTKSSKPASTKPTTTTKPKPTVTPWHTYTYGFPVAPSSTATKQPHPLTIGTPA